MHRVPFVLACICLCVVSSVASPAEKIKVLIAGSDVSNGIYDIGSQYARFAELARRNGFAVEGRLIDHFTEKKLSGADILVLPIQARALGGDEIGALARFIKNGGGVLVLGYSEKWYIGSDLVSLGALAAIYGISFAESTYGEKAALVTKDSPLGGLRPAAELCSPYARVELGVVSGRAAAAAVFESGGILAALSTDAKALGRGHIVVCGDASMLSTEGSPAPIDVADNAAFFMNTLAYLAGGPDLGITKLKFIGDEVAPGDSLVIKARLKNHGNLENGKAVLTVMLVGAEGEAPVAEPTRLKKYKVEPLSPGSTRKYSLKVRIPSKVSSGEYLLFVKVEPKNGGVDTNAENNTLASRKSLTVL